MDIIGIIFSLIVAVIGGVIAASTSIPAPIAPPVPPVELDTETAQVSEIEMGDVAHTGYDYKPFDTVERVENDKVAYTPASGVDYHIPDNAYNILIERGDDRTNVFYTVDNENDNQCQINAVYYTNGTAASSMNCDPLQ